MISVRLGLRVAWTARGRSVLFLLVGAVACAALSTVVMAGQVKSREQERRAELVAAGERAPQTLQYHVYRGSSVLSVVVNADKRPGDRLPGMAAPLAEGEMLMSPSLAERANREETLGSWFPYRLTGEIGREGIGSAGELKAYIGASRALVDRGDSVPDLGSGEFDEFGYLQLAGFTLFVAVPALALVATAGRFGRAQRVDRLRVLRLLGVSKVRARLTLAAELAIPAAVGAVAAQAALLAATARHWFKVPVVGRPVFGADARLSFSSIALVVVLAIVATSVTGASVGAERRPAGTALVRRFGRLAVVPATAVVYALGVAVAAWAWIAAEPRDSRRTVAIVLIGVGLPAAVALAAAVVARLLSARREPLNLFLAARRIAFDARVATRLAGMVAVMVFVIGVSQPVSAVLSVPDSSWVDEAEGEAALVARVEGFGEAVPFVIDEAPPGSVRNLVPVVALRTEKRYRGDDVPQAIVATCAQIEALAELRSDCTGERQRLAPQQGSTPVRRDKKFQLRSADSSTEVTLDAPGPVLSYRERQMPLEGTLLIPPSDPALSQLAGMPEVIGAYFTVPVDYDTWEQARGWVVRTSPLHRAEQFYDQFESVDSTPRWVLLGTLVTALFAACAVLMVGFDDRDRAKNLSALQLLGVGDRRLLAVHLVESFVGAVVAVLLAAGSAFVVTSAFLAVNDESNAGFGTLVLASSCGFGVVLGFGALVHLVARHRAVRRR